MKRSFFYSLIAGAILFCPCCDLSIQDYGKTGLDNYVELMSATISTNDRKLILNQNNTLFVGTEISVNDSYSGEPTTFTLYSSPLPKLEKKSGFTPLDEMLIISNTGDFSQNCFFVKIPIRSQVNSIPVAFAYNEFTETLMAVPIVDYDQNHIIISSRNFNQVNWDSRLKSGLTPEVHDFMDIVVGQFELAAASGLTSVLSDFVAGIDDWEFVNYGTGVEPKGTCAGMTLSALFYYEYRRWAQEPGLTNAFDRDKRIWQDNTLGLRLVSQIQNAPESISENHIWQDYIEKMRSISQEIDYNEYLSLYHRRAIDNLVAQLQITNNPVYASIAPRNSLEGYHAVLITGVGLIDSVLYIADPNYPGQTRSATIESDGFINYQTGETASENLRTYERLLCLGSNQMNDWSVMADFWRQLYDQTIGDNRFPTLEYTYQVDQEGNSSSSFSPLQAMDKNWLNNIVISEEDEKLLITCKADSSGTLLNTCLNVWANSGWLFEEPQETVEIDLKKNDLLNKTIGLLLNRSIQKPDGIYDYWLDFKWVSLSDLKLKPETMKGEKKQSYTWEVEMTAPPKNIRVEWDFGDNSSLEVIENSMKAKHTYDQDGEYNIVVSVFDDAINLFIGQITGKAKIGAVTFDVELVRYPTREPLGDKVTICDDFLLDFSIPSSAPSKYTISFTLGGGAFHDECDVIEWITIDQDGLRDLKYNNCFGAKTIQAKLIDLNGSILYELTKDIEVVEHNIMAHVMIHRPSKMISFDCNDCLVSTDGNDSDMIKIELDELTSEMVEWSGNTFTVSKSFEKGITKYEKTMTGELDENGWNIVSLTARESRYDLSHDGRLQNETVISVNNIPKAGGKYCDDFPPNSSYPMLYRLNGGELSGHINCSKKIYRNTGNKEYYDNYTFNGDFADAILVVSL